ncbi:hypothetical protein R5W23_004812 [Gemmata sp. JC673]|uniref:MoxR-vWA-beta-propeller ternary system domain-containing protein n=1 Tax=Gemmata algarum TaxID=2975278 RepID=A0ABU5F977_9BACT|nr:hypothetical protein [Gemmata algarum]MDY3563312.1 hypothetical protein [Gemmata algarum]
MRPFHDWLNRLLEAGESVQEAPPLLSSVERPAVAARLHAAFELHALDVAGPPLEFDAEAATDAAVILATACWLHASANGGDCVLRLDAVPSASAHLSADVALRLLPSVYRRARMRAADGPLTVALDRLLRAWPLSGVLADMDGAPTTVPDFRHAGLQMLYAERLASTRRAGWVPHGGPAREWAERVFAERGFDLPEPLREDARV